MATDRQLIARHRKERAIGALLALFSGVSILTTIGIVVVLLGESFVFFAILSSSDGPAQPLF